MKYYLILLFVSILFIPQAFAEEFFNGYSSIDPPLSEVVAGKSTEMNIRFLYTSGPYVLNNFSPIIEVNPSSAKEFVKVKVDSIEITQGQIKRIPVILSVDSHIEHDKIFLSISYVGNHFKSGMLQKSSWNDQLELDVKDRLVTEPEQNRQIPENCGPGTTLQDGICAVNELSPKKDSVGIWGSVLEISVKSPHKQIKSGILSDEILCRESLTKITKPDGSPACVTESTKIKLIERGWAHIVSANLTLNDGQSWGYIKDVLIFGNGYVGITMSYPTNDAYHELYPNESNSIVGNCNMQNDSANLSILYLNNINSDASTITFTKENKIFDDMSCDDAFWDEMTRHGYCGPPSHLTLQRETLMSSIIDAQNMMDFTLVVPKYLPAGYDVQKIMVDDDKKHVTMFISPMPVTNETDMCKFTWSDGGIYLSYVSIPEDAPRFSNDPDKERITINENRGYVKYREIGDRAGTPIPQGSEVTWHIPEGNIVLNMHSSLSAEELIKIAEQIGELESKPNILLDIASIEKNRITLNPTDTCAHISLRLLSADKLEQYQSRDKEVQFFEITETDLEELSVLDELIQATHHLEFTTNDDARAEMGLRELVDYEFFIMEKSITKYNDSQDDYFLKLDGNLDEKLADPKPQGFSNEFLSPQLVYDDKVYVLSHTFFWVANEHETQHMSVHLQDSLDNDKKFITFTENDMESIPKIKQAIEKIGTEFESIRASKGLPENPDWNEYWKWFEQKKTEQFNLDETYVPGFVYNDEYYDLGFPIC